MIKKINKKLVRIRCTKNKNKINSSQNPLINIWLFSTSQSVNYNLDSTGLKYLVYISVDKLF